jgi:hypothetical protein
MRQTLLSNFEETAFRSQGIEYTLSRQAKIHKANFSLHHCRKSKRSSRNLLLEGIPPTSGSVQQHVEAVPRSLALTNAEHLKAHIIGDDGIDLPSDYENRLADPVMISKLQSWLVDTSTSQTL